MISQTEAKQEIEARPRGETDIVDVEKERDGMKLCVLGLLWT